MVYTTQCYSEPQSWCGWMNKERVNVEKFRGGVGDPTLPRGFPTLSFSHSIFIIKDYFRMNTFYFMRTIFYDGNASQACILFYPSVRCCN